MITQTGGESLCTQEVNTQALHPLSKLCPVWQWGSLLILWDTEVTLSVHARVSALWDIDKPPFPDFIIADNEVSAVVSDLLVPALGWILSHSKPVRLTDKSRLYRSSLWSFVDLDVLRSSINKTFACFCHPSSLGCLRVTHHVHKCVGISGATLSATSIAHHLCAWERTCGTVESDVEGEKVKETSSVQADWTPLVDPIMHSVHFCVPLFSCVVGFNNWTRFFGQINKIVLKHDCFLLMRGGAFGQMFYWNAGGFNSLYIFDKWCYT